MAKNIIEINNLKVNMGKKRVLDEKSESLGAKIKKVTSDAEIPDEIPCIFMRESSFFREYFIYPFKEEFRKKYSYDYKDLNLNEI